MIENHDGLEPNYMSRVIPNCHRQIPVLSLVGKGPKGDKGDKGDNNQDVAKSGTGMPIGVTADFFGQIYLDTINDVVYVAKTDLTSWIAVN